MAMCLVLRTRGRADFQVSNGVGSLGHRAAQDVGFWQRLLTSRSLVVLVGCLLPLVGGPPALPWRRRVAGQNFKLCSVVPDCSYFLMDAKGFWGVEEK